MTRALACALLRCASALVMASCATTAPPEAQLSSRELALGATPISHEPAGSQPEPAAEAPLPGGEGPVELSVEQALLRALRHNKSLQVEQLATRVVGANEAIERGVFDPELFARFGYSRDAKSETTDVTGDQFAVRSDADAVEAGVRQRWATGTDVELSAQRNRSASSRRPEQYEARLGLTVTQSLLRGLGPAVNLAEVRQVELESLASVWELRGFTEALLAQAEQSYWRHVLASRRIAIVESSLQVAEQQLHEVEQFIAVGKLAPIDAAPLHAEVASRRQALIDARSARDVERLRLSRLTGLPAGALQGRELTTTSEPGTAPLPIDDLADRLALAKRLRGDLNQARLELERSELQVVHTENGLLPRLDLFVSLGKSGYAASFGGSVEDVGGDSYDFAAGLELSHSLGNRSAGGRDARSRFQRRRAEAAVANLEELVALDVELAVLELSRSEQQIGASAATRALREESVRAAVGRLRAGTGTALELAQAQRDLLGSQLVEVESKVAYRFALVALYRAEGSLLERRGLRLAVE